MVTKKTHVPKAGVLVLASSQHTEHPYAELLADLSCPLLAIVDEATEDLSGFACVRRLSSWQIDAIVEHALSLHEREGFDRVVGLGEVDILPAARIRETLGLRGQ